MSVTFERRQGLSDLLHQLDRGSIQDVEEFEEAFLEELRSARDSWLVEGVVDHYLYTQSHCALKLLLRLPGAHCTKLFERLDVAIHGEKRLMAFYLLGNLVAQQPIWLPQVVGDSLFQSVLQCLQAEMDLPVLMSALVVVTIMLPSVPSLLVRHMDSLFKVFRRLAEFLASKYMGNVPDILLLQLKVGINAYFHRLYAMYPCNLRRYLRNHYFRPNDKKLAHGILKQQFEAFIAPFFSHLRFHPWLILSSEEMEQSPDTWRQQESHDILVTCGKLATSPKEIDEWALDYLDFCQRFVGGSLVESYQLASVAASRRLAHNSLNLLSQQKRTGAGGSSNQSPVASDASPTGGESSEEVAQALANADCVDMSSSSSRSQSVPAERFIAVPGADRRSSLSPHSRQAAMALELSPEVNAWSPSDVVGLATPPPAEFHAPPIALGGRPRASTETTLTASGSSGKAQKGFFSFVGNFIDSVINKQGKERPNQLPPTPMSQSYALRRSPSSSPSRPRRGSLGTVPSGSRLSLGTNATPGLDVTDRNQLEVSSGQPSGCATPLAPGNASCPLQAGELALAVSMDADLTSLATVCQTPPPDSVVHSQPERGPSPALQQQPSQAFQPLTHSAAGSASSALRIRSPSLSANVSAAKAASAPQQQPPRRNSFPEGWSELGLMDRSLMEQFDDAAKDDSECLDGSHTLSLQSKCSLDWHSADSRIGRESLSEWTSARSLLQASSSSCSSSFSPPSSYLPGVTSYPDLSRRLTSTTQQRLVGELSMDRGAGVSAVTSDESVISRSWPTKCEKCSLVRVDPVVKPLASPGRHAKDAVFGSWPCILAGKDDDGRTPSSMQAQVDFQIDSAGTTASGSYATAANRLTCEQCQGKQQQQQQQQQEVQNQSTVQQQVCSVHGSNYRRQVLCRRHSARTASSLGQTASSTCSLLFSSSHLPPALPVTAVTTTSAGVSGGSPMESSKALPEVPSAAAPLVPLSQVGGAAAMVLSSHTIMSASSSLQSDRWQTHRIEQDLMEDLMVLGAAVHNTSANELPVSYQPGCDWSHFGESPHSDEIVVLQCKVLMLHSQLLFERYMRIQHAQRHREMQAKVFLVQSLEEELNAVKDQLGLQEVEVLKMSQMEENRRLEVLSNARNHEAREGLLKTKIRELELDSVAAKEQCLANQSKTVELSDTLLNLRNEFQHLRSEYSVLQLDHLNSLPHVEKGKVLQHQVNELRQELVQCTSQVQALQDQQLYAASKDIHLARLQQQLDLLNGEFDAVKDSGQWLATQRDAVRNQVTSLEEALAQKDLAIEQVKDVLRRHQQAAETKEKEGEETLVSLTKTNERLEQQIGVMDGRLRLHQRHMIVGTEATILEVPTSPK